MMKQHEAFERLLVITPDNAQVWFEQGIIFAKLTRHKDAISAFDNALSIKPDYFAGIL